MSTTYLRSGIYQWRNLTNGKLYIGSANNLCSRKANHLYSLRHDYSESKKLQNAFNKYGEKAFIFEVLELIQDKTQLIQREQHYLNTLLFASEDSNRFFELGYNIRRKAESNLDVKMSLFTKQRFCKLHRPHNKPVVQLDKNTGEFIAEFYSIQKASKEIKAFEISISNACKGRIKSSVGFKWMFKKD